MDLLLFKLAVSPLLVVGASMAVRRWGAIIGGFLVGLPLTSGPISVFLTLERGPAFAIQASSGSLAATAGQVAFCLSYCCLAHRGWRFALTGAALAFAVVASALTHLALPAAWLFGVAMLAAAFALRLMPFEPAAANQSLYVWWDLPARVVLMAALIASVTLLAPTIGPRASGVLASFPFMAAILNVFAHRSAGAWAARQLMRGMTAGLFGFACFFYVVSIALSFSGTALAYTLATASALTLQWLALRRMQRADLAAAGADKLQRR